MLDLVRDLSLALRDRVLPSVGSHAARAHDGDADAVGGDVTFVIDADAEAFLGDYLAEHAPDIAFYSEDRGLVDPARGRTIEFQGQQEIPAGGDVIVGVGGRDLTRSDDLADLVSSRGEGDKVKLEVIRKGERRTVEVTLGERPEGPPEQP